MSGSNDALTQMLLMQARQNRQPSTQARLAQQMMQANMQQAQTPIWGTGATLARAGSGVLAGLMSGMAERSDREREDAQMQQMQDRQDKAQFLQGEEAANFARTHRLPGAPPLPAPQLAEGEAPPPQAPQQPPDWRGAALAGFGSNNPAIQRQAQAALSIGQMEDQQAARLEQARLARELAVASRAPRAPSEFEQMAGAAGIRPGTPEYQELARSRLQGRPPATRDERDDAILFAANADPNNPDYAAAYFRRFMTPRIQSFRGLNGEVMQAEVTLSPPPGLRQPGSLQSPSGQPAAPPGGVRPAMASGMQPTGPVVSDAPTLAVPQASPSSAMPNAAPVPAQMQPPAAGRGLNINPLFSGERQAPPPPGFERDPADPSRVRPIPGGPAVATEERAARALDMEARNTRQQADIVVSDVNRILRTMETTRLPVTGFGAETMSRVPGSPAADVRATLDTLEAAAAFGSLQAMRQASPTGAALGAVSDTELRLLSATMGSLRNSQSPTQFRQNLIRFRDLFEQTIHGPNRGTAAPGSQNNPAPAPGGLQSGGPSGWSGRVIQ